MTDLNAGLDRRLMRRAIALGRTALGKTWPNPAVGCVLAHGERIVGEGATGAGGRPHAEELALATAGAAASGATAYVTLEPCGARTSGAAACADRIASAGVLRVIIACNDPTDNAAGQGIARLRDARAVVEVGLLAGEAADLSAGFVHRQRTGRPLLAITEDSDSYDCAFEPMPGETLEAALDRLGRAGYTRVWARAGSASALEAQRLRLQAP